MRAARAPSGFFDPQGGLQPGLSVCSPDASLVRALQPAWGRAPGYRRARELAAASFDRALSLLDEPAGEIDIDDEGEYEYDEVRRTPTIFRSSSARSTGRPRRLENSCSGHGHGVPDVADARCCSGTVEPIT